MWAVASSTSNYDVPTSGRRWRPVDLIVACVVIVVTTSFAQGNLTMPDVLFETCHQTGTCPQYYYCSKRDSRCEPCSSCARPNDCQGSIAQCEKSTILFLSDTTYMASLRHDLSPSCDATELRDNKLLSAACSRHCFTYKSSLLCLIGTECIASCTLPGVSRGGVWPWVSSCSCLLNGNELVCSWTEPLPACTNATVNIQHEMMEGTPQQPFTDVDTGTNASVIIPHEKSVTTLWMPPIQPPASNVDTAENSTNRTSAVMKATEIAAFVCAIIATSGAVAAIAVGLRLRRRVTSHRRQNFVDNAGTATDGQATVINNSVHHVNLQVAEIGHLSVGSGGGGSAISASAVQVHGQHNRPTASCVRCSSRCRRRQCRCDVASPLKSRPYTVRAAATASDGVRGSLCCDKCRHLDCSGVKSPAYDCNIGSHGCKASGDCSGEPGVERDDCDESGGCSRPLLQLQPEEATHTSAADLALCCGRPVDSACTRRHEYAGGGGHCGDGSFYVEADAVPDDLPTPNVIKDARPGRDGCDCSSLRKPGVDAAVDCSCCVSDRCATCSSSDEGGGCRYDCNGCLYDLAECPDSCESISSSDRCSEEVAHCCEGCSEASEGLLSRATIVDPEPNARVVPSHRSVERTVIKANCVSLLEIIPTADAARAGNIAADLELGNVGLLRVGLSTIVADAQHH